MARYRLRRAGAATGLSTTRRFPGLPGEPGAAHVAGDVEKRGRVKISNLGTALLSAQANVRLLASSDATADAGDLVLSEQTLTMRLKPRQSKGVRLRFAYPAMARGAYHLIVQVDAPGAVPETSESNNKASAGECGCREGGAPRGAERSFAGRRLTGVTRDLTWRDRISRYLIAKYCVNGRAQPRSRGAVE